MRVVVARKVEGGEISVDGQCDFKEEDDAGTKGTGRMARYTEIKPQASLKR
jgi:hypothetical protein